MSELPQCCLQYSKPFSFVTRVALSDLLVRYAKGYKKALRPEKIRPKQLELTGFGCTTLRAFQLLDHVLTRPSEHANELGSEPDLLLQDVLANAIPTLSTPTTGPASYGMADLPNAPPDDEGTDAILFAYSTLKYEISRLDSCMVCAELGYGFPEGSMAGGLLFLPLTIELLAFLERMSLQGYFD